MDHYGTSDSRTLKDHESNGDRLGNEFLTSLSPETGVEPHFELLLAQLVVLVLVKPRKARIACLRHLLTLCRVSETRSDTT